MRPSPWKIPQAFPASPAKGEFGWWDKNVPREAPREDLIELCRDKDRQAGVLVWTTERGETVVDREVEWLREAVREREQKVASHGLGWAMANTVLFGLLGLMQWKDGYGHWQGTAWMLLVFGLLPLAAAGLAKRRAARSAGGCIEDEIEAARYDIWVARRRAPCTWLVGGVVTAIFLAMLVLPSEVQDRAVLNKAAFWGGEWWRGFTGPWLHANILHVIFNLSAWASLGKAVEAVFGWRWLVVVLAVSLLAGSLASASWLDASSAGLSGGILGLLGFQIGVAWRTPWHLPKGVLKRLFFVVGMVAVIGLAGVRFIDNAAHLGGLVAGALSGAWGVAGRRPGEAEPGGFAVGWALLVLATGVLGVAVAAVR